METGAMDTGTPFDGPTAELLNDDHVRCPICGDPVDWRDLDALARHLELGHQPAAAAGARS